MFLSNLDWQPSLEINDFYSAAQSLTTRNLTHWLFSTDCNSSIFLIAFIFTWVPPDLQRRWSLSSVCSDRERGSERERRHATFHPKLMCQAYHTAERSWGDILHWISDISRTVQIYPSLSSIRLDFSIHRVSILITEKRMSENFLFSAP